MKYSISREDLLKLIDKESLPAIKQILLNHLHIMDGENTECSSCKAFDSFEPLIDDIEEEFDEVGIDEEE